MFSLAAVILIVSYGIFSAFNTYTSPVDSIYNQNTYQKQYAQEGSTNYPPDYQSGVGGGPQTIPIPWCERR